MGTTLAEAKAQLGFIQAAQDAHKRDCPCRHLVKGRRPACEERSRLEAEAKQLRQDIKTWHDMPEDAEKLF